MKVVSTTNAPAAIGPYSQALDLGNMVFVSGQIPVDPATGTMADTVEQQAAQSLANLVSQQNAAGHRANYQFNIVIFITTSDFLAQALGIFRMLQYVEFFNIHGAMQAAGQQEVAVEHSFGFF